MYILFPLSSAHQKSIRSRLIPLRVYLAHDTGQAQTDTTWYTWPHDPSNDENCGQPKPVQ